MIEEVNEMLAHKAEDHDVDLIVEYHAGVPRRFIGDAGRIRQVLTNLVGNAVKFTRRRQRRDHGRVRAAGRRRADMRFAVQRHRASAFRPTRSAALFEKFSQVDGSPTRKYGGTGLGLAISKQLVELMGGAIGVESRAGRGVDVLVHGAAAAGAGGGACAGRAAEWGLRALIVDDNELNRRMLRRADLGVGHARRELRAGRGGGSGDARGARERRPVSVRAARLPDAGDRWRDAGRGDQGGCGASAKRC